MQSLIFAGARRRGDLKFPKKSSNLWHFKYTKVKQKMSTDKPNFKGRRITCVKIG